MISPLTFCCQKYQCLTTSDGEMWLTLLAHTALHSGMKYGRRPNWLALPTSYILDSQC